MKLTLQKAEFFFGVGGVGGGGRAGGAESVSAFMHRRGCGFSSRSDADYLEARDWKEVQRQRSLYFPPDTKEKRQEAPGVSGRGRCMRTHPSSRGSISYISDSKRKIR